jgi:hypothetical protein
MTARVLTRRLDRRGTLGRARATSYRVGRSQPNDEIAQLDGAISQLRADVTAYDPPTGSTQELANWASIKHEINGLVLRWGQFVAYVRDIWYWSDGDDVQLTQFRNEYNAVRKKVLDYTQARVEAPEVETPKEIDPDYEPPPEPPTDLTVKELVLYLSAAAAVFGVGWVFVQYKYGAYLSRMTGGGGVQYARSA